MGGNELLEQIKAMLLEEYSVSQWVLLFFLYSFCGWCWEVFLYLVKERRFVNRGFLFGPILPILVVEDAESAIRFINKRSRPLAAYVFSRDHEVRLTFERQTSSGALGYSLPLGHLLSSRLPFGGVGASGIGTYHGKAGFLTFSHIKTVVTKPQFPDTLRLVYPPFNEAKAKLFDIIAKFS